MAVRKFFSSGGRLVTMAIIGGRGKSGMSGISFGGSCANRANGGRGPIPSSPESGSVVRGNSPMGANSSDPITNCLFLFFNSIVYLYKLLVRGRGGEGRSTGGRTWRLRGVFRGDVFLTSGLFCLFCRSKGHGYVEE